MPIIQLICSDISQFFNKKELITETSYFSTCFGARPNEAPVSLLLEGFEKGVSSPPAGVSTRAMLLRTEWPERECPSQRKVR